MPQPVLRIALRDEERETLNTWSRSSAGEHRMVERSRAILLAAEGLPAREIARQLKTRLARVSKWRQRFCRLDWKTPLDRASRKPTTRKPRAGFWPCWMRTRQKGTVVSEKCFQPDRPLLYNGEKRQHSLAADRY
jgi:hypothetical protein